MQLGRRVSAGVADDPPASVSTDAPVETEHVTSPDQRAAEIVAAAHREFGELAER
jgi:hypothetical protein